MGKVEDKSEQKNYQAENQGGSSGCMANGNKAFETGIVGRNGVIELQLNERTGCEESRKE